MIGVLRKLRGRSVDELRERAAQAAVSRLESWGFGETIGELSDEALWQRCDASLIGGTGPVADRVAAHFAQRAAPSFLSGIRDGSSAAELSGDRWAESRAAVVREADRVRAGRFHLLGYEELNFGTPIDWHLDPVAGKRAPIAHWSRIPYLDAEIAGDHKVIWELNRHQHFFTLGRSYRLTGRDEYAETFAQHLGAWMDANPPKTGMNWASSLEIAYRSIAWMWALEFFRGAAALTPALLTRLLKFAYAHGRHLERYLSTYFSPNTHLTGEALGLLYLGTCLPELRCAEQWRERGWRILESEATRQIHADGVYFEQTTYYHRYTLDIYLHAIRLAHCNGFPVGDGVRTRVQALARCLADVTRADGTIPAIGDDDGGQLVLLEDRTRTDVRASLVCAAVMLDLPTVGASARTVTEEVVWMLGANALAQADACVTSPVPAHTSQLFPIGGVAVLRDGWTDDGMHAVLDCGPLGMLNCGHAHADTLSMELWVDGADVCVDPGTFVYTTSAADRTAFRHSAMHNTVTVDGQASSVSAGPFSWQTRTDGTVQSWWQGAIADSVVATHDGFHRLDASATHRRAVYFVRGRYVVVVDSIVGTTAHDVVAHWHCAPGAVLSEAAPLQRTIEVATASSAGVRAVRVDVFAGGSVRRALTQEGWVSPAYGARVRAPVLELESSGGGRHDLVTLLVPVRDASLAVERVDAEGGYAFRVTDDKASELLLIGSGEELRVAGATLNGDFALLRSTAADCEPTQIMLAGPSASLTTGSLRLATQQVIEASMSDGVWNLVGNGVISSA